MLPAKASNFEQNILTKGEKYLIFKDGVYYISGGIICFARIAELR